MCCTSRRGWWPPRSTLRCTTDAAVHDSSLAVRLAQGCCLWLQLLLRGHIGRVAAHVSLVCNGMRGHEMGSCLLKTSRALDFRCNRQLLQVYVWCTGCGAFLFVPGCWAYSSIQLQLLQHLCRILRFSLAHALPVF